MSIWGLDKGTDNYHPIPLSDEGKDVLVKTSAIDNIEIKNLLKSITNELKNINKHLSLITDEIIEEEDL